MSLESFSLALEHLVSPEVLLAMFLAAIYGLFVGAVPGFTATMAVALFVPIAFFLDTYAALAAIVTLVACAIFAGDIPGALLRMPGTPASAAYVDDAFALTRAGRWREALGTSVIFSAIGGLIGAFLLCGAATWVAGIAYEFSSVEYFWLTLLGLSCAVVVSRGSPAEGTASLAIGLLLATVGLSPVHSQPRFTFGADELIQGVSFIPAMIGLFGLSEVLRNVLRPGDLGTGTEMPAMSGPKTHLLGTPLRLAAKRKIPLLRSSVIGSFIGMLPGAGADIAAWISYAVSKRFSKHPKVYGTGSVEGLADATAANNSALAGAWMPALILGIPGDSVTAIVLGILMMKDVTPGPKILEDQPTLVAAIYLAFFLANFLLVPIGAFAARVASHLVRVPRRVLLPLIVLFSIVGSYSIAGNYFDVGLMLAMGVLGFILEALGLPLGPVVLGLILGPQLEETFIQNWTKARGDGEGWMIFFGRPWSADPRPWATALASVTILVWVATAYWSIRGKQKQA